VYTTTAQRNKDGTSVSNRRTLVEQTRNGLLADLLDGVFAAGSKLPSEQELAKRFQVSRLTVREAVGGLVESGFVTRRQGSGTYVTSVLPRRHALDTTVSYTAMIREAGMKAGLVVLNREVRAATPDEADRLGVARDEPLMCLERIRTADERPVIYSLDRIPERFVEDIAPEEFDASLYMLLDKAGYAVRNASARLTPVIVDARLARLLEVADGSPLLHIHQIDYDDSGHAVMASSEWHVPDVFELHVNRRPT
jgi:GntR family transcriptional regulator